MDSKTPDVTDDFLKDIEGAGVSEFVSSNTKASEASDKPSEEVEKSKPSVSPLSDTTDSPPALDNGDVFPAEYLKVVDRVKAQYSLLPSLDYNAIDQEIRDLTVKSCPTPTLEILNDELHKVQSAKDRLAEILIDVIKCYNFKKRAVDILKESWGKFTSEKNTESRKGDATFRLSFFLVDFAKTESLFKSCDHILRNLDSLQDNLSRRITIWQMLLKVREGRMALPDYDFDKELGNAKIDDLFGGNKENSEEGKDDGNGPKLREF